MLNDWNQIFSIFWVYLGAKNGEVFLCFVALVRVRVYYVDLFVFLVLLVSHTGSYRMSPFLTDLENTKEVNFI